MRRIIPPFYGPTSILFVDDDPIFAQNTLEIVAPGKNTCVEAPSIFSSLGDWDLLTVKNGRISLAPITKVENWTQFQNLFSADSSQSIVSTLIIDHCMDPFTGLEICRKIKSPFITKILVSNFPDETNALNAISEGIIDSFYCKREKTFFGDLSVAIEHSKLLFFSRAARLFPEYFRRDNPLLDSQFANDFFRLFDKYKIHNYKTDAPCRTLHLFDEFWKKRVELKVYLYDELEALIDGRSAESATKEIIELIRNGVALPWFENDKSIPDGNKWHQYLHPAQRIAGQNTIRYCVREMEIDD